MKGRQSRNLKVVPRTSSPKKGKKVFTKIVKLIPSNKITLKLKKNIFIFLCNRMNKIYRTGHMMHISFFCKNGNCHFSFATLGTVR